jgi:hypothetical protein
MGIVRVAQADGGRLVRVGLTDVDERVRLLASRRMREQRWERELRPDYGYTPTMRQREEALWEAILLERAALAPSRRRYLIPEDAAAKVLP